MGKVGRGSKVGQQRTLASFLRALLGSQGCPCITEMDNECCKKSGWVIGAKMEPELGQGHGLCLWFC